MFLERLEKVREQPKEVRARFAFMWSLVLTGLIVLVWISILLGRSYALKGEEAVQASDQEVPEILPEDLRTIFDDANSFLDTPIFEQSTGDILNTTSTTESLGTTTSDTGTSTYLESNVQEPLIPETTTARETQGL